MTNLQKRSLEDLKQFGYVMLAEVFNSAKMASVAERLSATLDERPEPSVLRSRGQTYGSRNLLETFPEVAQLPNCPSLREFVTAVLGPTAGIV